MFPKNRSGCDTVKHISRYLAPFLLPVLMLIAQPFAEHLTWSRDAIHHGGWWRLISGQLVHTNYWHLALNGAGWLLAWDLGRHKPQLILYGALLGLLATAFGLWLFVPELIWYRGFSGAMHGVFMVAFALHYSQQPRLATLLMAGLSVKVILEQIVDLNQASAELIGTNVVEQAHLAGWLGTLPLAVFVLMRRKQSEKTSV